MKAPNHCFGCGEANPQGMKLTFARDEQRGRISARLRIGSAYQGGLGMLHGGIVALLLDEAMGKVCRFSDVRCVTAELSVEFKKPVPVEQEIAVEAWQESRNGRSLHIAGEIRRCGPNQGEAFAAGELLARGRARFVVINPETYTV